jgi:hypothetical protein
MTPVYVTLHAEAVQGQTTVSTIAIAGHKMTFSIVGVRGKITVTFWVTVTNFGRINLKTIFHDNSKASSASMNVMNELVGVEITHSNCSATGG